VGTIAGVSEPVATSTAAMPAVSEAACHPAQLSAIHISWQCIQIMGPGWQLWFCWKGMSKWHLQLVSSAVPVMLAVGIVMMEGVGC
jgi:hypothetical protein